MKIRNYKVGDALQIYNLFALHTVYQRDAAFWVWINRMLSDINSIITVAEKDGQIVGHYAIIPRICILKDGVELKCGLGIHAFVDPLFRQQISIYSISQLAYTIAKSKGFEFIYGFPNKNYRLIQEKIERWKNIATFNAFEKPLINTKNFTLNYLWKEVKSINYNDYYLINELMEQSYSFQTHFKKSLNYFINRYLNHPQSIYKIWIIENNKEIIGCVVTKIFQAEIKHIHIIDFIVVKEISIKKLILDFENIYCDKADKAVLWPVSRIFKEELIRLNYSQTGFDTFFGLKIIGDQAKYYLDELLDINNWILNMGDSDAF